MSSRGVACQGFSLANRKRWREDERNLMFWAFKRVVDLLKPTHVLIENVTGLKSMDKVRSWWQSARALNPSWRGVPRRASGPQRG